MTTTTHPVAPEDVMAWLDGELTDSESRTMAGHIADCAKCTELVEQFRLTANAMALWTVETAPASLDAAFVTAAEKTAGSRRSLMPQPAIPSGFWNWKRWVIGGAGTIAALLIAAVMVSSTFSHRRSRAMMFLNPDAWPAQDAAAESLVGAPARNDAAYGYADQAASQPPPGFSGSVNGALNGPANDKVQFDRLELAAKLFAPRPATSSARASAGGASAGRPAAPAAAVPMIARSVSLVIQVRDFTAARAALDAILARHHGYSAQLTVNTPEGGARNFQASLRIPAPELAQALENLKTLGRVQNETQSGEEVTQQHADLAARLKNSREEEGRLRDILTQRTGKIEDVLEVEQEIANVRGQIESMDAEQTALEHRVDFASVEVQLSEEYKAQLNAPASSVSNRLRNALVSGIRNAGETVLGIMLFFEEAGPVMLIWTAILGLPVWLAVRRYRRARARTSYGG